MVQNSDAACAKRAVCVQEDCNGETKDGFMEETFLQKKNWLGEEDIPKLQDGMNKGMRQGLAN